MKKSNHIHMNAKPQNRREFLRKSIGTAAILSAPAILSAQAKGSNQRIGIGFIGAGGRSTGHMRMLKQLKEAGEAVDLVAVCDIYRPRGDDKASRFKIARIYETCEELLDDPDVDAVVISTPDHHHAPQAIKAIRAGKDVYCEKPVSHWSQFAVTKKLAEVVASSDRVFQLGTQAMSDPVWKQMKKLVQEGLIGQPLQAETGYFRTGDWGERGMKIDDPNARPGSDINWEAFLGDAPERKFSVDRFFRWRLFKDYAGGPVTDLYPHSVTQVVDILGLSLPERVVGLGAIDRYDYHLREVPDSFSLVAHYPEKVMLTVMGTQGNNVQGITKRGSGFRTPVIRGWDGTLSIRPDNKHILFYPTQGRGIDHGKPPRQIPIEGTENFENYWQTFLTAIRERKPENSASSMDLAYRTQTLLQMAMKSHIEGTAVTRPDEAMG